VPFIYIDPPYNTDASSILYKNNYKDSAWLSLISSRLEYAKNLLQGNGMICVAIDDEEVCGLRYLLRDTFEKQVGIVAVRSNPAGRKTKGKFAPSHEYALFFGAGADSVPASLEKESHTLKRFPLEDEKGRFAWANLIRSGTADKRADRPTLHFPIYVSDDDEIRIPEMTYDNDKNEYIVHEPPREDERAVYPIVTKNGTVIEKRWQRGQERIIKEPSEYRVRRSAEGEISIDFKTRMDDESLPITWWDDKRYASANYGAAELKELFSEKQFDFAKATKLVADCIIAGGTQNNGMVVDFFAGSATTGHAVVALNREDDESHRKYILVEMGLYFDTVTKPRMQKVVYSADWKDGKPQNRTTGVSQIIKYMRLESYEDALSNIELSDNAGQLKALLGEDYMIHYMVDLESRGSLLDVEAFANPFAYTMKITEKNECKERPVDLVETFNYLIGLTVARQSAIEYYLSKPAEYPAYEGAVDLVSDISGQYVFRQIEGSLPDGRRALVIWRTVTEDLVASNAALDAYFTTYRKNATDRKYDVIFVNGDSNLENLRGSSEGWTVQMTEIEFKNRMFEEA
ncbi:MAG: DNA methyltransferase, partial [Oscillospiraceae bacterium]|nr:DNA methyltransferase [Oscillospiraceae bacterium]